MAHNLYESVAEGTTCLVCDTRGIPHPNGAYWEAGFAEDLGLPVIYTCKKAVLQHPDEEFHFDTRNQMIIMWDTDNLQLAASELRAIIRNTLPGEALLETP